MNVMKNLCSSIKQMICIGIASFESEDVKPMNCELNEHKIKIIYLCSN